MEFLCYASGNYHPKIYLTKDMDSYVCWHDLDNKSKTWHHNLDKALAKERTEVITKRLQRQDLYIFDDIHMDDNFKPRQKKSDV